MTLDTSGGWEAGDDLLVMEALELPFSYYTKDCLGNCMNEIENIDTNAVGLIKALLTEYKTAKTTESTNNLSQSGGGKTLVKADVLEWEIDASQIDAGPMKEVKRVRKEIALYFGSCACIGNTLDKFTGGNVGVTSLYRS